MKKIYTLLTLALAALALHSCSDSNDGIYLSNSGEGSIVVGYSNPTYLYRMVFINSSEQQELYLFGSSAYVTADEQFSGRGAVVKFVMPADTETLDEILQAQTFDINGSDYSVSYSTYVNYSTGEGDDSLDELSSGTVIIRRSGQYYDIRLLGVDSDSENILISYRGYIYRWFYEDSSSSQVSAR